MSYKRVRLHILRFRRCFVLLFLPSNLLSCQFLVVELREEEDYIANLRAREAELKLLNEETLNNLARHRRRVADFHRHFSQFNSVAPAARETQTVKDEIEKLKAASTIEKMVWRR